MHFVVNSMKTNFSSNSVNPSFEKIIFIHKDFRVESVIRHFVKYVSVNSLLFGRICCSIRWQKADDFNNSLGLMKTRELSRPLGSLNYLLWDSGGRKEYMKKRETGVMWTFTHLWIINYDIPSNLLTLS